MTASALRTGIAYCILGAVSWGINGVVSQFLFTHYVVDSSWITAIRMTGSGLVLLALILPRQQSRLYELFRDGISIRNLLLFSLFGLLLCQYAYLTAIKFSNSATATVLQTLSVVLMSMFLAARFRRKPSRRELISVVLAFTGVFFVATNGNPSTMVLSPQALFWGLVSAVGAVSYPTLAQGLTIQWDPGPVNALGMLIGGSIFCLAAQVWTLTPALDAAGWLAVAFIIFVGTALSFTFFLRGIRIIGPMKATLISTLEPVTAAVVSAAWLGTPFHPAEIAGFIFIIITVFLIAAKRESK